MGCNKDYTLRRESLACNKNYTPYEYCLNWPATKTIPFVDSLLASTKTIPYVYCLLAATKTTPYVESSRTAGRFMLWEKNPQLK